MYSKESLQKVVAQLNEEIRKYEQMDTADFNACISSGNRKIGRVLNVSLAPMITCVNCSECCKFCYDIKANLQYPNVRDARARNTVYAIHHRKEYFEAIGRGYIFWNSHADVVKSIRYYQIGSHSNHGGWYGTKADADAKAKTQKERFHSRCVGKIVYHDDARRKAVLPFIRRQQGCKTAKLSDIRDIAKCVSYHDGSIHYVVTARGKEFVLR